MNTAVVAPMLAVSSGTTLGEIVGHATERPRVLFGLAAAFAAVALLLAWVGIYSVLSYVVSQRTGELSIRMALGAAPGDVTWLVVRYGLALAAIGTVAGGLASLAVGRALSAFLYGVTPRDPVALASAIAITVAAALGASVIPARRAAALDPIVSLRTN